MKRNHGMWMVMALLGMGVLASPALAAQFDVTLSSDPGNTWTANTLRWAAAMANATPGYDLINITIQGAEGNTITVSNGAIVLLDPVNVQGHAGLKTTISGNDTFPTGLVFNVQAAGSTLQECAIIDFTSNGVMVRSNTTQIINCRIGTNWDDEAGHGNGTGAAITDGGIRLIPSTTDVRITNSVISGNNFSGIYASGATSLAVRNCKIGTTADGLNALPNAQNGILLEDDGLGNGCSGNYIGGDYATERNVISGNSWAGVCIRQGTGVGAAVTGGNFVYGNIIGMKADLSDRLDNTHGVIITDSSNNYIGRNTSSAYRNLIAGNRGHGVWISTSAVSHRATGNQVQNNEIGLANNTAYAATYGSAAGVYVSAANSNLIGGCWSVATPYDGNIISGYTATNNAGIRLSNGAAGNTIGANLIGTDTNGTAEIANRIGVYLEDGSYNLVGGQKTATSNEGNVISGFAVAGVDVAAGSGNSVCGNIIGLNVLGNAAINASHANAIGVRVQTNATSTLIGGATAEYTNVIAGLGQASNGTGIAISANTNKPGTIVAGNLIGTSTDGLNVIPNHIGVNLDASSCRIGGRASGEGNRICGGNANDAAIMIQNASADGSGNTIAGNWLGVLSNGTLPSSGSDRLTWGIVTTAVQGQLIGRRNDPASSNLIAGTQYGINLGSTSAVNNGFFGNTICAFTGSGINLPGSANHHDTRPAPVIASATIAQVSGTCAGSTDYVEVFQAEARPAAQGGSLKLIGTASASAGVWTAAVSGISAGDFVCALSTDAANNTTDFSLNVTATAAPALPTPTVTPTATATPVVTSTPTNAEYTGTGVKAFPNPAQEQMTFILRLESPALVTVAIFNLAGERLAVLSESCAAGTARLVWDCRSASSGVYLARVQVGGAEKAKLKVALLKK